MVDGVVAAAVVVAVGRCKNACPAVGKSQILPVAADVGSLFAHPMGLRAQRAACDGVCTQHAQGCPKPAEALDAQQALLHFPVV